VCKEEKEQSIEAERCRREQSIEVEEGRGDMEL
jgi:hypothetical protein